MSEEIVALHVTRYRDKNGAPTCVAHFCDLTVCVFYLAKTPGVNETCVFAPRVDGLRKLLVRRDGGVGSLVPGAFCPVWRTDDGE